jgi:hypothetical protein
MGTHTAGVASADGASLLGPESPGGTDGLSAPASDEGAIVVVDEQAARMQAEKHAGKARRRRSLIPSAWRAAAISICKKPQSRPARHKAGLERNVQAASVSSAQRRSTERGPRTATNGEARLTSGGSTSQIVELVLVPPRYLFT